MTQFRLALANLHFPSTREESVSLVQQAIADAADQRAQIICFPEGYVPGYRAPGKNIPRRDAAFLDRAWKEIAVTAAKSKITVILGTERIIAPKLYLSALVIHSDGSFAGFQDKIQIDASEIGTYAAADTGRHIFQCAELTFGIAICHEAWRYPETVRWAARRGAQIVFHPHFHEADAASYRPTTFADPQNTFHEKAALCRAAENTCYFATVNCASSGSPSTSAVIKPDGAVQCYQPYGKEGLLIADVDLDAATCLLAKRFKPIE
jgi:predicted amidohydrolase